MGVMRRRSWQTPLGVLLGGVAVVALAAVVTASTSARSAGESGGVTRLLPPDGKAYFGLTFRLWDTPDPVWGDARPLADRIRDSIQFELAGKTPTFLTVWAAWQKPDLSGQPLVALQRVEQ